MTVTVPKLKCLFKGANNVSALAAAITTQNTTKLAFFSQGAAIVSHYAEGPLSELSPKTQQIQTIFKERNSNLQIGCHCPIVNKSVC